MRPYGGSDIASNFGVCIDFVGAYIYAPTMRPYGGLDIAVNNYGL